MKDQRQVADPHPLAQVGRLAGRRQVRDVPHHGRAPLQPVALLQPLGDPVRDRDHRVAAADQQALDRRRQTSPERLAIGHAHRILVGVVDEPGAARDGRQIARDQGGDVVRVDDVGALRAGAPGDCAEGDDPPERARQPPGPIRRHGRPQPKAAGDRPVVPPRQVHDDDIVPRVGQRARLPEDPPVVNHRLVEQNRYPHRNSRSSLLFCGCMRRLSLLLGLVATLILVSGPAAQAAEKSIWGPATFPVGDQNCPTGPTACSAFPVYKQLGAQNYQFQIPWDTVALSRPSNPRDPNDPAYHWPAYADYNVQQAAQNGISLAVLVQGTPSWANGGRPRAWVPDNLQDFADFMYALSRRYPSIHRWEIWGEPSYGFNFQPMPPNSRVGPRIYAKLLDSAYVALKQASRSNIVIGGMSLNGGGAVSTPDFVKWLKIGKGKKARPPRMDLWGHNPFEGRLPNIKKKPIGKFRGLSDVDTLYREI